MQITDIKEFHYITHIDNLESILKRGILCKNTADKIGCISVASKEVQERRKKVTIPGTKRKLHDYANLYFNARNPMMYKLLYSMKHENLSVVIVDISVMNEQNVVLTDGNAASDNTIFLDPQTGLNKLRKKYIYAKYWTSSDFYEEVELKRKICAEMLVPKKIDPAFINGIYVSSSNTQNIVMNKLQHLSPIPSVIVNKNLFFQ